MPPRKAASNGKSASPVVQEFKYRSIGDIEKKRMLEMRRGNMEAEHYGIQMQIEVLQEQPLGEHPNAAEERDGFIIQLREQQANFEGMIRSYSERIADIDAALVAGEE